MDSGQGRAGVFCDIYKVTDCSKNPKCGEDKKCEPHIMCNVHRNITYNRVCAVGGGKAKLDKCQLAQDADFDEPNAACTLPASVS